MGLLDQILSQDAAMAFLDMDGFAEVVTYTKAGGGTRTINAIVDRDPPMIDSKVVRPKMQITVANNSTTGIASAELDTGDTITVAYRIGDVVGTYCIRRPSVGSKFGGSEDSAMLDLELE